MTAIRTRGLTKRFGETVAVDDVDLTVERGEVFGFLGANGAGKSTTINCLLDFLRPTEGSIEILGADPQTDAAAVRRRIGVLPEGYGFEDDLTGREYVEWVIRTKEADDDADALLREVGLADAADRYPAGYSKGMQQRLAFAMALVGDPDLLVLDEPSSGLDPNGMRNMREIIRGRAADGATVFFSSHILSEVEAVCDRVGVMNGGRLVAVDTLEGLRDSAGAGGTITLECARPLAEAEAGPTLGVAGLDRVADAAADGRTLTVTCSDTRAKVDVITHVAPRVEVVDITAESVSLQSLFAELTGGSDDGTGAETGAERSETDPDGATESAAPTEGRA